MGCNGSKPKCDAQQKAPNAEPLGPVTEDQVAKRRMIDFKIEVTKASAAEKLGVTFNEPEHGKKALHVKATGKEGTIPKYNSACAPEKRVLVGDDIIEVNGVSGNSFIMMQELAAATKLIFTVLRGDSRNADPLITALAVPNESKAEHTSRVDVEQEGAKGADGAVGVGRLNQAASHKVLEHEVESALTDGVTKSGAIMHQATEIMNMSKAGELDQTNCRKLLENGELDHNEDSNIDRKLAMETLDPKESIKLVQKDALDMLNRAIESEEEHISINPDEGETGPCAGAAKYVYCW